MSRIPLLIVMAALAATGCAESGEGGITARLVFQDHPDLPGLKRASLRTAALPSVIDRLQILALDTDGSTLAETNLWAIPNADQLMLIPEGGEWALTKVRAGDNRSIQAKAFLGASNTPRLDRALAFVGRKNGIQVSVGKTTDAGVIVLMPSDIRIPEADFEAPSAPNPLMALPIDTGESLRVTFGQPSEPDTAGYVLAVGSSTASSTPPAIERSRRLAMGEAIAPGLQIAAAWAVNGPQIVQLDGLTNGVRYNIAVYAYDDDGMGGPLNYSIPATTTGIPIDSAPPNAPGMLTVTPGGTEAAISFIAPGEDGAAGTPAQYEIRTALQRTDLENNFEGLPAVMPPPIQAGGSPVMFTRSYGALGFGPGETFFVGVRAIDPAANVGPTAIALHTLNATLTPSVDRLVPHIAIAGLEVQIIGTNFGTMTGTVSLVATETSTLTYTLAVTQWSPTLVSVAVPADARSGVLTLRRPDGEIAGDYLTVIQRTDDLIDDHEFPFELIGSGTTNARSIAALYREGNENAPYEAAIERLYDDVNENTPFVPFNQPDRSTSIAGTYNPGYDRFMFVASNANLNTMSTSFISTSTVVPNPIRQVAGVAAGNADRVSVVFLDDGVGGNTPAMIAFTVGGTIRTATVADAQTQPFNAFYATSSTVSMFDRVTIARDSGGQILMAHRTVTGTVAELTLRRNPVGGPDNFLIVDAALRPRAGPNFQILSVPTLLGGPQSFVIAYEEMNEGGVTDVRLLRLDEYGTRLGYAPFTQIAGSRRLDDVGIVVRNGQVYIAVAATRVNGSAELSYAEIPATGLNNPDTTRGLWPGVVLDSAPSDSVARIGCKPFAQRACPIVWLGDDTRVFFIRR